MYTEILSLLKRPALYEQGTMALWTDEHISKGMLLAHLDPDWDAATRKPATLRNIVQWIAKIAPSQTHPNMLDLGCGPGLYAEAFHDAGYTVSGIDISTRSIEYAKQSAQTKCLPISYHHRDYLTMDDRSQYDLITLIYYDFGVLSPRERAKLLNKVYAALKPGGLFIVEVLTPEHFADQPEKKTWTYEQSGFFCADAHLCLHSFYRYDAKNTILDQYVIVTDQDVRHINNYQHCFTKDELSQDLSAAGFDSMEFYGNMLGSDYRDDGKEICAVAHKKG